MHWADLLLRLVVEVVLWEEVVLQLVLVLVLLVPLWHIIRSIVEPWHGYTYHNITRRIIVALLNQKLDIN